MGAGREVVKSFVFVVSTTYILCCMGRVLKGHESSKFGVGEGWCLLNLVSVEIYRLTWNSLVGIVARLRTGRSGVRIAGGASDL